MVNLKAILEKAPEGATHYTDSTPSLNVYVKVVHLDGCYLHLGGKWERYPFYAGLKCLDDFRGMLELQSGHDALAAAVEALRLHLAEFQKIETLEAAVAWEDKTKSLVKTTPQQHLRDVRAEAGRAGCIYGINALMKAQVFGGGFNADVTSDQYAERVKDGEK